MTAKVMCIVLVALTGIGLPATASDFGPTPGTEAVRGTLTVCNTTPYWVSVSANGWFLGSVAPNSTNCFRIGQFRGTTYLRAHAPGTPHYWTHSVCGNFLDYTWII